MANFNKVILAGNLTRDPELRYTPKGTAVVKMGMAINHTWKSESGESGWKDWKWRSSPAPGAKRAV